MNGWVGEWVDGWVNEQVDEWVNGWVGEWVNGWVGEWVNGWVGEWVDGWVNGWINSEVYANCRVDFFKARMNIIWWKNCDKGFVCISKWKICLHIEMKDLFAYRNERFVCINSDYKKIKR